MKRKKKFVIWLFNRTSNKDDEWKVVWAHSRAEANMMDIPFDKSRFSRGYVLTAAEFRFRMGISA